MNPGAFEHSPFIIVDASNTRKKCAACENDVREKILVCRGRCYFLLVVATLPERQQILIHEQ
jgi:hypothetical protein